MHHNSNNASTFISILYINIYTVSHCRLHTVHVQYVAYTVNHCRLHIEMQPAMVFILYSCLVQIIYSVDIAFFVCPPTHMNTYRGGVGITGYGRQRQCKSQQFCLFCTYCVYCLFASAYRRPDPCYMHKIDGGMKKTEEHSSGTTATIWCYCLSIYILNRYLFHEQQQYCLSQILKIIS